MAIDESKPLSRRKFLKGAGVSVAAIAAGGVLGSCAPQQATPVPATPEPQPQQATTSDWKVPPNPFRIQKSQ
jgi:hypothetical protein